MELAVKSDSWNDISSYPNLGKKSLREAIELQQNFYELSSDWNYYKKFEYEYLKKNIKYSLFGSTESDPKHDELIEMIFNRIVEASRSKNSLYVGTIFNILWIADKQEDKSVVSVPVFKVRRCMEDDKKSNFRQNNRTKNTKMGTTALYSTCVNYVDLEGRIYRNWTDYVNNNTLPKCIMVLPMGGFYQENPFAPNTAEKTYVWIEIGTSPLVRQILPYLDTVSTVLGVGALGVGVAAMAAPAVLAAPVVLAGTVLGATSGAYATGRSTQQLIDRRQHQQSISITDKTARSSWFGVVGGLAGGLSSGSTFLLNNAVKASITVGNVSRTTYNAIAFGNIVVNGMGISNGIYGMYKNYREKNEFSVLEITQVMAHILFFGNAVMNFQTAQTIINNTQQQVLQDYEQSLRSNRHRKVFRRIKRNTQASNSDAISADSEIIRGIRSIQNKDDFFAGIVRNRKVLSAANAEVTFKDGYAMINDNVKFDPIALSQQPTEVRANVVGAAQPFNKSVNSIPQRLSQMPEKTYRERVDVVTKQLTLVLKVAPTAIMVGKYIGQLIVELRDLPGNLMSNIITKLAKDVQCLVKENRQLITYSIEKLMYYIWNLFVRPQVDNHLRDMGIDVNQMAQSPAIVDIVYTIILTVIDEIFDGVENLLENIIAYFSYDHVMSQSSAACTICSGCVLNDS